LPDTSLLINANLQILDFPCLISFTFICLLPYLNPAQPGFFWLCCFLMVANGRVGKAFQPGVRAVSGHLHAEICSNRSRY
jgi:hypothetical protein